MASGVQMVGRAPDSRLQIQIFGSLVVSDLPSDTTEAVEVIDHLVADPDESTRVRHAAIALRAHDWAHRWLTILTASGAPVPDRLEQRIEQLDAMADQLEGRYRSYGLRP